MRIAVEAGSFFGHRSGVGRYGLCLVEVLSRQRQSDALMLFGLRRKTRRDFALGRNMQLHTLWLPSRLFSLLMRYGVSLPLEFLGVGKADVYIFPNFIAWASLGKKRKISVVHDIAFMRYPKYIQKKNLKYLRRQLGRSLHRSTKVVAVSEATKQDLIDYYKVPAAKIAVVPNAVDHDVFNPHARERTGEVLKQYRLPKRYLLFVGTLEPRKNIVGLLDAYASSFEYHKLPLVLVGGRGWNDRAIGQKLRALEHLPVHQAGFVPDADLAALYAGATAFVYPSFYEGFGIPLLEAMASGCPVVCSNVSSLPEVVGEAAITVDPHDTSALAAAITTVATKSNVRKRLIAAGLQQAQQFSWERSAKLFSDVIDVVAQG